MIKISIFKVNLEDGTYLYEIKRTSGYVLSSWSVLDDALNAAWLAVSIYGCTLVGNDDPDFCYVHIDHVIGDGNKSLFKSEV